MFDDSVSATGATKTGQVEFGKTPATAGNRMPQAFSAASIQVLLGDGSAHGVNSGCNATFTPNPSTNTSNPMTIWRWACSSYGGNGNVPPPAGW
jgi:hypothetical protein